MEKALRYVIGTFKSSLEVRRVQVEWKKMNWGYGNKLEFSQNEKKVNRCERMSRKRTELAMLVSWLLEKKRKILYEGDLRAVYGD